MNRFVEWVGMRNLMMLLGVASAIGSRTVAGAPAGGFAACAGLCMVAAAIVHAAEARNRQAHDDKAE